MADFRADVLGLIFESPITAFSVRSGPGTTYAKKPFTIAKGTRNLRVLDIQPDENETRSDFGRVYQWFLLEFPAQNTSGWMRGHVIGIQGDYRDYGYGFVAEMTHAYELPRDESKTGPTKTTTSASSGSGVPNALVTAAQGGEGTTRTPANSTSSPNALVEAAQGGASSTEPNSTTPPTPDPQLPTAVAGTDRTGTPMAIITVRSAANTRQGPSTVGFSRSFTIPRSVRVPILEVRTENRAQHYRWFRVRYQNREAWIREDLVRWDGDTQSLGLPEDLYPPPMKDKAWWVRGYNHAPHKDNNSWDHWGWDFGANTGEQIFCGPHGGRVVDVLDCSRCSDAAPNVLAHGLRLNDPGVLRSRDWGFGYGNFVVVAYENRILPPSTRQALEVTGRGGSSLYVMYAHLQRRLVNTGDAFDDAQPIAHCGNSGNSQATHLHLEVRIGGSNYTSWSSLGVQNLVNPIVLFSR